ncbi:glutamine--tRNA ligase/YqeY domain fusion protein [Christensenellaceae bacterium OttesenSCG-928-L17]|nr:glutamine--tRNA ligase/YqeY domain fusion protein [Christensenellaceae bacterium OttesenSCG-928-L17]
MEELLKSRNFIEEFIDEDLQQRRVDTVRTRFPPEPNGYLHIGHAKALYIDFSIAEQYGGECNLRYDDTNPTKEDEEYVDAIQEDIRWLGFQWANVFYGSDYFDTCYQLAVRLIKKGVAYVCDLSRERMREYRGTLTEPGKNSPYRERSVEENLDLFVRMKNGEFAEGTRTLRAKIDMASPNMNMRDPAMYRIIHASHHHTGDEWCIYPMYDFAHPIQDAIEGVTHSLCSLEYEIHRPLYDWVLDQCEFNPRPRQIEFARLNLTNTIMSKRYLRALVEGGHVDGWDDPRMPTLCGMRRRGYTPAAIRDFLERVGVAKVDSLVDTAMLEHCVREDLNQHAPRMMAVIDPVKLIVENWPAGERMPVTLENHPNVPEMGARTLYFTREVYIEREDFMIDPPKKYFRLRPDGEVRLKGAYIVRCTGFEQDEQGNITCIRCTYDPTSKSGESDRKVKGTLHWVSAEDAVEATVRLYEPLMMTELASKEDFIENLNPNSLVERTALVEPALAVFSPGDKAQFMRVGYFNADDTSTPEQPVFNRTVVLKDSWKPNA